MERYNSAMELDLGYVGKQEKGVARQKKCGREVVFN